MKQVVGKCGHCGGRVMVPTIWHGINPPVPECESCHAQVDVAAHLPVLPMIPRTFAVEHLQRETVTADPLGNSRPWFRL